ncbi:ATP-dependent zn protease [Colletotrichum truncatum]|uniref:ATP-dependent zn protease n=1 Tax=Colletotrichum truncatum TaxID=5467 RepID=A0ACC3ZB43_COLTU|nr:ATP-dependent zn protease [Colletotrichum truncatum]KAF6787663.1 ATP-dependent zn protease [Colletotrichum truncatum]
MPAFPRWNTTQNDYPMPIVPREAPRLPPRSIPSLTATTSSTTKNNTPNTSASSDATKSSERSGDSTTNEYYTHSSAKRVNTDLVITKALKEQYPHLELVVIPESVSYDTQCNLLAYAHAGFATYEPIEDDGDALPSSLEWLVYLPPARRMDGNLGGLANAVIYGKYLYKWKGYEFIVYLIDGRDSTSGYIQTKNYYVLTPETHYVDQLVLAAGSWSADLHDEVWVYDQGMWQKSRDLFESTRNATWDNVILDEDMKKALIDDHWSFYNSRETYQKLKVPWKRGLIYYGPPGNGKTISIKATMRMLYEKNIPTLYVRTLTSYAGPEYSLGQIFGKARQFAPCYLVFEDLDTIVSDNVRSYFLNEIDGLKANDGIFIIGSTNHLDRLDPGISKRPSRFDRKYYFPEPNLEQRVAYCKFWQNKLKGNKEVEFPDKLCRAIAKITDKFSFAYIQEAFVAALLAIAQRQDNGVKRDEIEALTEQMEDDWLGVVDASAEDEDLEKLILWVEIKRQVEILREGMEEKE